MKTTNNEILLSEVLRNLQDALETMPDQRFVQFFSEYLEKQFGNPTGTGANDATITPTDMILAMICTINDFQKFLISTLPIIAHRGAGQEFTIEFLKLFSNTFCDNTKSELDKYNAPTPIDSAQAAEIIDFDKACKRVS